MSVIVPASRQRLKWRMGRRQFIEAGGSGLVAAGVAACGRKTTSAPSGSKAGGQAGAQASQSAPVSGGTLNVYVNYNTPLDPQKTTVSVHVVVAGVYSRVFKFKTALDQRVALDHDVENDLGLVQRRRVHGVERPSCF